MVELTMVDPSDILGVVAWAFLRFLLIYNLGCAAGPFGEVFMIVDGFLVFFPGGKSKDSRFGSGFIEKIRRGSHEENAECRWPLPAKTCYVSEWGPPKPNLSSEKSAVIDLPNQNDQQLHGTRTPFFKNPVVTGESGLR